MSGLLGLPALRTRVERYFQFETVHLKLYREELIGPLPAAAIRTVK
jgi:hypothetical protein